VATPYRLKRWTVVTKANCVWCDRIKELLKDFGCLVTYIDLDLAPGVANLLLMSDLKTVPQAWCDRLWIGGYDSTLEYIKQDVEAHQD
jgi:glutaredoxin